MMLQWTSVSHGVNTPIVLPYNILFCSLVKSGADGGLDFQCIKVGEDVKQSIQLKNKGKYDIEYRCVV